MQQACASERSCGHRCDERRPQPLRTKCQVTKNTLRHSGSMRSLLQAHASPSTSHSIELRNSRSNRNRSWYWEHHKNSLSSKKREELFTFDWQWGFKKHMGRHRLQVPLSFEEIMRRHEREILRYLLRVSGDREDAADLFQETWLRAYRAYPRLDSEDDVRPWLYSIATNLCRNRARDSARRARVVVPDKQESPAADGIGKDHRFDHENEGYAAVHLRELIAGLPT